MRNTARYWEARTQKMAAELAQARAERDEAQRDYEELWETHQRLSSDHYFARAEKAEKDRDELLAAVERHTARDIRPRSDKDLYTVVQKIKGKQND